MTWHLARVEQEPTKTLDAWMVMEVPFDGADYLSVLNAIQSESPRPMGVSLLAVPAALELIVNKALKKRKEQRFHAVKDFAGAIRNYLSGRSGLFSLRRKVACL